MLAFLLLIIIGLKQGHYKNPDFSFFLFIQAHGMLFNFFLIGIFALWMLKREQRKQTIRYYCDEIDDLRGIRSPEAAAKIKGNILRLNRLGVLNLELHNCYLAETDLVRVDLRHADLWRCNLNGAYLRWSLFQGADLRWANLQRANLGRSDMRDVNLRWADLTEADMGGADLAGASLNGASLEGAFFWRVKNLTFEQMTSVATLHNIRGLDRELAARLHDEHPHLFEKPEQQETSNR